jgi:DNA-binding NarL/FixJ family response regulator
MRKLCVLLADDHKMVRDGLRMLIDAQPDMTVVGEADNGRVAVSLARQLQPDVVVMDVAMPELNGLKATEQLRVLYPSIKILTLTRHTEDGYLHQLLKAGANGYVLKQSASDELVRAIRAVADGKSYLDQAVMEQIIGSVVARHPVRGCPAEKGLSHREEEVLRLSAWGYLNKEIADRLHISIKTAEAHKANAMTKLGLKSRIDIVRYALLQDWLKEN